MVDDIDDISSCSSSSAEQTFPAQHEADERPPAKGKPKGPRPIHQTESGLDCLHRSVYGIL